MRRLAFLFLGLLAPAVNAQDGSLVGKVIIAKEFGVKLTQADADGKIKTVGELTDSINYRVLEQKGNQIKLRTSNGAEGWCDKSYALSPAGAVKHFSKALIDNPNNAAAYQRRSYALESQGDYDNALKDINETIRLSFVHIGGWNSRGLLYCARKEYDKAITDLSLAIRLAPHLAAGHSNRGYAWMMKKDYDKALNDLNTAIFLEPTQPYAYNTRGLVWFLKKDYPSAHSDFNRAQKLDPNDPQAYLNRARLFATSADPKERDGARAVELAKHALSLANDPEPIFHETLAAAYAEAGLFAEAIRTQALGLTDPRLKGDAAAQQRLELYRKKTAYREK
jgi:tetratricopeptide (TPR) repeat protein